MKIGRESIMGRRGEQGIEFARHGNVRAEGVTIDARVAVGLPASVFPPSHSHLRTTRAWCPQASWLSGLGGETIVRGLASRMAETRPVVIQAVRAIAE